jgi:hypothetical protein
MPWTREKLEAEWIGAPIEALGDRAPAALSAFDCVEKHLGAEWLAARHLQGSGPELHSSPPPMLFYFELKRTIERIGNQQGFFTVCLDPLADHAHVLDELAGYADGPHCEKLIVPKGSEARAAAGAAAHERHGQVDVSWTRRLGRTLAELTKLSIRFGVP